MLIALERLESQSTYFHYLLVQLGCFQNFPEPIMPFLNNNLFYNTHTDMYMTSTKADTILVSQFKVPILISISLQIFKEIQLTY